MTENGPKPPLSDLPLDPDGNLPPRELIDSTPDEGDIPAEIEDAAEESKHDVSDD